MGNVYQIVEIGDGKIGDVASITAIIVFKESPKRFLITLIPKGFTTKHGIRYTVCNIHDQFSLPLT